MSKIIGGTGILKMVYNYVSNDNKSYRIGTEHQYTKVIKYDNMKECGCSGKINTFYIVNKSKIPTSRAIKIR
jgi:uncharacterized protein (UPF0248 family)